MRALGLDLLGGKIYQFLSETEEEHTMRYFFPLELKLYLESTGFNLVRLGAFPDFEREPDETSWNLLTAARATELRGDRR